MPSKRTGASNGTWRVGGMVRLERMPPNMEEDDLVHVVRGCVGKVFTIKSVHRRYGLELDIAPVAREHLGDAYPR